MKNKFLVIFAAALCCAAVPSTAQVASNPPYVLEQSVIASGGGQNATRDAFTISGTIGQPAAGTRSTNSGFSVTGGFWIAAPPVATAAEVSIAGRVLTPDGRGLRNALVTLTDSQGQTRTIVTGAFGYFRFSDVATGATVVVEVRSKRYQFQPQILTVMEEIEDLNFEAAMSKAYSVKLF